MKVSEVELIQLADDMRERAEAIRVRDTAESIRRRKADSDAVSAPQRSKAAVTSIISRARFSKLPP